MLLVEEEPPLIFLAPRYNSLFLPLSLLPPLAEFSACYNTCSVLNTSTYQFTTGPDVANSFNWWQWGGAYSYNITGLLEPCDWTESTGSNVPFVALNGCPSNTFPASDLSSLPSSVISTPAAPALGFPPPSSGSSSCRLASAPNGAPTSFSSCVDLPGAAQLLWSSRPSNGGNVSLSLAFSMEHDGWIGFGLAPQGGQQRLPQGTGQRLAPPWALHQ